MAAPVIPNIQVSDALNNTSSAMGGRISNGMIFNTSGGGQIGIVKLVALGAFALIAFKIWRKK